MTKETYDLKALDGTKVTVTSAARRDALLDRGYTEAKSSSKKTTEKKS